MERTAQINRKTKETDICLTLQLDGAGKCQADTGIGFFDHMLDGFARHGFFDLKCMVWSCKIVSQRFAGVLADKDGSRIPYLRHHFKRVGSHDFHML